VHSEKKNKNSSTNESKVFFFFKLSRVSTSATTLFVVRYFVPDQNDSVGTDYERKNGECDKNKEKWYEREDIKMSAPSIEQVSPMM